MHTTIDGRKAKPGQAVANSHGVEASGMVNRLNKGHGIFTHSVQPSTVRTYGTGERRWFKVALEIGTDPCMRIIPIEWEEREDLFQGSSLTWPEACIVILLVSFT